MEAWSTPGSPEPEIKGPPAKRAAHGAPSPLLALALATFVSACSGVDSAPREIQSGTSFAIALGSSAPFGFAVQKRADQTGVTISDPQRGAEQFYLCPLGSFATVAAVCESASGQDLSRPLDLRLLMRVAPGRGSPIDLGASFDVLPVRPSELGGTFSQQIAVFDLPLGTPAGTYEVIHGGNSLRPVPAFRVASTLTVVAGASERFTDIGRVFTGFAVQGASEFQKAIPFPAVDLVVSDGDESLRPAAAELVLRYPAERVAIRGSYDSGVDSQVLTSSAGLPPDQIRLSMVNPSIDPGKRSISISVAFEPLQPAGFVPVEPSDFEIVSQVLYDRDANELTGVTYAVDAIF